MIARLMTLALVTICFVATGVSESYGQNRFGRRYSRRPTTSPYLNLLRSNRFRGSTAFQYYRRTLPEQEFRSANQRTYQSLDELRSRVGQPEPEMQQPLIGTTGHPTSFLSLGGYFGGGRTSTGRR